MRQVNSALAGLAIALGMGLGIFTVSLMQRQRYERKHQQTLARMAHLRTLANPPTDARRDRVGYM
jgi:uncharacterized protein HemX